MYSINKLESDLFPPPPSKMFRLAFILLICIFTLARTGRHHYNSYVTPYRGSYRSSYYRTPYQRQYQGYSNYYQRQYQGYQSPYQNQYSGYGNYYQNYYAQRQPYYTHSYYGGDRDIGNGIHVDSHGNGYIGSKDTGLYIFCASRGCVGRG
uniref:Uncharacterized protein n=1 Tax=Caenorhabditis tropicalis TaxID=1561998 RepID=A0A1I7T4D2_9PELO